MEYTEHGLRELDSRLCNLICTDWESDNRFETKREMQMYNRGISNAMDLIQEMLDSMQPQQPKFRGD